IFAEDV
nr:Chain A, IFAEDV [Homo sapiens]5TXH_B Chain B, IFAEDV [Homo sapiens]5TXH_C Chain C, IFAEDV [Homo sapiens]5TXH_D Chain D, IFAEDV [Homo sapiens]5TXJ_A Chain A, amyloid-beta derived peptide [Homo sapiens]5TXJ_B Chain B, amyloid-beta derived peptide [Homo sapiens]